MIDILGCTRDALQELARRRLDRTAGIAPAVYRAAHRDGVYDPSSHGIAAAGAAQWRQHFALDLPAVAEVAEEPGPVEDTVTAKARLRLRDGREVETVRIPIGTTRESQCLSTQVGCGMACRFCETAKMGRVRSLSAAEIVGQVVAARTALGWSPKTIVFQGMGEPLDNTSGLFTALDALTDPHGLAFAWSSLTVCTVGHLDGLYALREFLDLRGKPRLNLSLSLNAADDAQRRELMPVAGSTDRGWSLAALQQALVAIRPRRNWQLGVHWCLMPGLNDSREDVQRIAAFCAPLGRVMLHLIPYNPGSQPLARAPTPEEIERFVGWLREAGLPVRRRITKGRSLMAACGQLATGSRRSDRQRVSAASDSESGQRATS